MMELFAPHFDKLQAAILSTHYHNDVRGVCSCGSGPVPYKCTSLSSIGAVLHLGHRGEKCRNRLPGPGHNTVIVHTNGIHHLCIEYCRCNDVSEAMQLCRS